MNALPDWAKQVNKQLKQSRELKKITDDVGLYPLCGTITTDMAIAALEGEQLGKGDQTDMLCVSYSQTDVIGHKWGTRGEHTDAAYLQLDKDLSRLMKALDNQVGKGNYLLFLTADHGAAHNFQYMQDHKLPAGKWLNQDMRDSVETYIAAKLGNKLPVVLGEQDYRFFLDRQGIARQGLDYDEVKRLAMERLQQLPNVQFVVDYANALLQTLPNVIRERAVMGYHPRRSGDILVVVNPGYYSYNKGSSPVGTTHGEWNPYDAHIPLLFYGWKVAHGATSAEVHITDIAPTICQMLHIQQPNACVGEPIVEVIERP